MNINLAAIAFLVTVLFVVLKLTHAVAWSWLVVFTPLLALVALFIVVFIVIVFFAVLFALIAYKEIE